MRGRDSLFMTSNSNLQTIIAKLDSAKSIWEGVNRNKNSALKQWITLEKWIWVMLWMYLWEKVSDLHFASLTWPHLEPSLPREDANNMDFTCNIHKRFYGFVTYLVCLNHAHKNEQHAMQLATRIERKATINPLSANPIKWSTTLKQFVGKLPTNCLSVFDHFVKLAFKGLRDRLQTSLLILSKFKQIN